MANYNVLKSAIENAVDWDNNDKQISGNDMLAILLSIINNTVTTGYLFAGIAIPTTNPGTPDQNVFYLTTTTGSYPNFGGGVVNTGELAVFKYNGAWTKDTIPVATPEQIDALMEIIASAFAKSYIIEWDGGTESQRQYYNQNGNVQILGSSGQRLGTAKIPCSDSIGKTIGIYVKCIEQFLPYARCLFVQEDNTVIESWVGNGYHEKVVPQNAAYLLLTNSFANPDGTIIYCANPFVVGLKDIDSIAQELNDLITFITSKIVAIQWDGGTESLRQYYNQSGQIVPVGSSGGYYGTSKIPCSDKVGKTIGIYVSCGTIDAQQYVKCLFVDGSGNVLENWSQDGFLQKTIPANAVNLLISNLFKNNDQTPVCLNPYVVGLTDLQDLRDIIAYVEQYLVPEEDYIEQDSGNENLFIPTLYSNSKITPTTSAGYTVAEIANPIPGLNTDLILRYTKTSGSTIFPCNIQKQTIGVPIGVWVKLANYNTYFRIHCGVQNASLVQRSYDAIDVDPALVTLGASYAKQGDGFVITAKCVAKTSNGYACFSVNVTSTNANDVYYNCLPYNNGGAVSGVGYDMLVLSNPDYPYMRPVKVRLTDFIPAENIYEKLCLPDKFIFEKGKTYQLFKRSMFMGLDYRNYNIQIVVTDDPETAAEEQKWCKDYDRYIQYTPLAVGDVNAKLTLFDNNRNVLDEQNIILKTIERTTQPGTAQTLLFIGDSLTYYNRLSDEFYRVLTSNDAATTVADTISIYTVKKPAGRGWGNITLIGTQRNNYLGWVGQTYHEGRSGWRWADFIGSGSPFKYNGAMDFAHYLSENGFNTPTIVYIGLGWNDNRDVSVSERGRVIDVSTVMQNAKTFLDAITTQWPNAKIRLWTQNITGVHGGVGNHAYGAIERIDEQLMNLMQFAIMTGYKTLVQNYPNVELVWSTAFIDTEYSLQEENADINTRISNQIVRGKDYVHPADSGFFEIADSIIADFCSLL